MEREQIGINDIKDIVSEIRRGLREWLRKEQSFYDIEDLFKEGVITESEKKKRIESRKKATKNKKERIEKLLDKIGSIIENLEKIEDLKQNKNTLDEVQKLVKNAQEIIDGNAKQTKLAEKIKKAKGETNHSIRKTNEEALKATEDDDLRKKRAGFTKIYSSKDVIYWKSGSEMNVKENSIDLEESIGNVLKIVLKNINEKKVEKININIGEGEYTEEGKTRLTQLRNLYEGAEDLHEFQKKLEELKEKDPKKYQKYQKVLAKRKIEISKLEKEYEKVAKLEKAKKYYEIANEKISSSNLDDKTKKKLLKQLEKEKSKTTKNIDKTKDKIKKTFDSEKMDTKMALDFATKEREMNAFVNQIQIYENNMNYYKELQKKYNSELAKYPDNSDNYINKENSIEYNENGEPVGNKEYAGDDPYAKIRAEIKLKLDEVKEEIRKLEAQKEDIESKKEKVKNYEKYLEQLFDHEVNSAIGKKVKFTTMLPAGTEQPPAGTEQPPAGTEQPRSFKDDLKVGKGDGQLEEAAAKEAAAKLGGDMQHENNGGPEK